MPLSTRRFAGLPPQYPSHPPQPHRPSSLPPRAPSPFPLPLAPFPPGVSHHRQALGTGGEEREKWLVIPGKRGPVAGKEVGARGGWGTWWQGNMVAGARGGRGTWWQGHEVAGAHGGRGTWWQGHVVAGTRGGRGTWWQGHVVAGARDGRGTWWQGHVVAGAHGGRGTWWQGHVVAGARGGRGTWWQGHVVAGARGGKHAGIELTRHSSWVTSMLPLPTCGGVARWMVGDRRTGRQMDGMGGGRSEEGAGTV
ncbi:unnamed protein product [Closterium sp. NIES-65]|nr:unnamed protein product [Closterium sp. NIES-65]